MSLRYYVFRNMGWKIGSLLMAILIWFAIKDFSTRAEQQLSRFVRGPTEERTFFRVPVHVVKQSHDDRNCILEPDRVTVTLQGDPYHMRMIREDQVIVFVQVPADLDGLGVAQELKAHCPPGVEVVDLEPELIKIRLKQSDVKSVPSNKIQTDEQF